MKTSLNTPQHYSGLVAPARAWMCAELFRKHKHIVLVTKDAATTETALEEIKTFSGAENVLHLPAWDSLPLEQISPSLDISAQRISVLIALSRKTPAVIVAPIQAVMQKVLAKEDLTNLILKLSLGQMSLLSDIRHHLEACGYQENTLVEAKGAGY